MPFKLNFSKRLVVKIKKKRLAIFSIVTAFMVFTLFQNCGAQRITSDSQPVLTGNGGADTPYLALGFSPTDGGSSSNHIFTGTSGSYIFTILNESSVTALNVQIHPSFPSGGFGVASSSGSCQSMGTLVSGATCTVTVNFSGGSSSNYPGSVTLSYTDSAGTSYGPLILGVSHPAVGGGTGATGSTGSYDTTGQIIVGAGNIILDNGWTPTPTPATPTPAPTAAPTAYYQLIDRYGMCVDLNGGSAANGTKVQGYSCWGATANNQLWAVVSVPGTGAYELVSKATGKCMDVTGSSTNNGGLIQEWDCNGTGNQLWNLSNEGQYSKFQSVLSGKCLDLSGGHADNGIQFQQYTCQANNVNQQFNVIEPTTSLSGNLRIRSFNGKCLDVDGGSVGNNDVPVNQFTCWSGGSSNQMWSFQSYTGSGAPYRIVLNGSGKCLDVVGASTSNGAKLQQHDCVSGYHANQLWNVTISGAFASISSVGSSLCLDLPNGSGADGVTFWQWSCNSGNNNQKFFLDIPH